MVTKIILLMMFGFSANLFAQDLKQTPEAKCQYFAMRYVAGARAFLQKFGSLPSAKDHYLRTLAAQNESDCSNQRSEELNRAVWDAVAKDSSSQVGIILPLTGSDSEFGNSILKGLRAGYGLNPQSLVIKDNMSNPKNDELIFAQLVMQQNIRFIIGGFQSEAAETLRAWSEKLTVTTILLSPQRIENKGRDRFAFYSFPHLDVLTDTLVKEMQSRNIKTVAAMIPQTQLGSQILNAANESLKRAQMQFSMVERYQTKDFDSIQRAAQNIFKTNPAQRQEDYRKLVKQRMDKAKTEGVAFNPNMVSLDPLINFDALFLPDNFKNLRHMVQIFKYLGVKSVAMMGLFEWRAQALLKPSDMFLNRSFFADFVGDFRNLPAAIVPPSTSGYFVDPAVQEALDFRIIGWRAGRIAQRLVNEKLPAIKQPAFLRSMRDQNESYFGNANVFDGNQKAHWPSSVFQISGETLSLKSH